MNLPDTIKAIQRHVGAEPVDGFFGPVTAAKVLAELQRGTEDGSGARCAADGLAQDAPATFATAGLDARTAAVIASLDPKCRDRFTRFSNLAKATAAAMGCDYRLISGYRSWEEQSALYAKGRTDAGPKVTNAAAGYSYHNFRIAADGGCFKGAVYLDGGTASQQSLAEQVHKAVSVHAESCGLVWGGSWSGFRDTPHWQVDTGHASPTQNERGKFQSTGSIL